MQAEERKKIRLIVREVINLLLKTKGAFKSKLIEEAREKLENLEKEL